MRILHIFPDREHRCVENYAANVVLDLQKADIEQCVVIDRQSLYAAEFKRVGIKTAPRFSYAPTRSLHRLWLTGVIAQWRPDLAHCWTRSATRLIPRAKMPIVGWLAGYDDSKHLTRCTHIISANRASALRLQRRANLKTRFIPTFSEFAPAPPLDRNALATPRDAKVLLNLDSLHPSSRLDTVLAALRNLPECVLWLAGEGPFRAVIEKMAVNCGVIDRVRFAAARMNHSALLRAADLCVIAAAERSFGTIIPKAWAAGVPVVASRQKGFAAPLDDGITGLLAPTGDETALANAIRSILDKEDLRRQLVAKGYAAYLSTYAREAVVRQWVEFYKGIGDQHSGTRG